MSKALVFGILLAGLPLTAYSQDNPAREGGSVGGAVGGAVGAVVGAPIGAATGLIGGLTGANAPRFHRYIVEEHIPSYEWRGHPHVVIGDVLPSEGVALYPVPREYGVTHYQYTIVDNEPVLVDPATRRVVEIIP